MSEIISAFLTFITSMGKRIKRHPFPFVLSVISLVVLIYVVYLLVPSRPEIPFYVTIGAVIVLVILSIVMDKTGKKQPHTSSVGQTSHRMRAKMPHEDERFKSLLMFVEKKMTREEYERMVIVMQAEGVTLTDEAAQKRYKFMEAVRVQNLFDKLENHLKSEYGNRL